MPARQDQTLQIFLIIFIFAFLVTAVVAYLGWRGYSESDARAVGMKTELDKTNTESQNQRTDLESLRQKMGYQPNDNTADVLKASDDELKALGGGIDEASRSYRKVLQTVAAESDQMKLQLKEQRDRNKDLSDKLAAKENEAKKQIDQYDAQRKKAEEDAANQRNSFTEYRATLVKEQAELQKSLDDQRTKYEGQITEKDSTIKSLKDMVPKLEHQIRNLNEWRKDEPNSFEVADGRISWVNQNGTVWINLGTADSLRRQVTFSVFDADQHDAAKASKKGSIEVTRVLGDHMAEARITKDDPKNPMLTGDNIYSQIWHRGKKLHFALTGVIDIDGDGVSDLQVARDLIELNGGVVDAYLKEDGSKVEGEITANTRYLILGDSPNSAVKAAMNQGFNDMSKAASSLGVTTITLPQFLDQMGYKPQDRTVHLGPGATAHDFPPRPENGIGPAASQPSFRPRSATPLATPPAATSAK